MDLAQAEERFIAQLCHLYSNNESKEIFSIALEHVTSVRKADFFLKKGQQLSPMDETSLMQILDELGTGKPLQYILGDTIFYGLRFQVNPDVLIPRPETEELVDWAIKQSQNIKSEKLTILDIGTGSGCIPIAIKKKIPTAEVSALDISHGAIETAIRNAMLNGTEVEFMQGDILNRSFAMTTKFDIIISNPPYITLSEQEIIHQNVLAHEPHLALFVPDDDALIFYDRIADFASLHLKPKGMLFFEINDGLGENVVKLLKDKGFSGIELRKDMQGKDRMVFCYSDEGRMLLSP